MFKEHNDSLQVLIDLGFLIPVSTLTLYHGRAREVGETDSWRVIPKFNNAGNATGNQNIFAVSALSTANRETAERFAEARAIELGGVPEVHRIIPKNGNELIINYMFDVSKLSELDKLKFSKALNGLINQSTSAMAPTQLKNRATYIPVYQALNKKKKECGSEYLSTKMISEVVLELTSQNINVSLQQVNEIAGALNARTLLFHNPLKAMHKYTSKKDDESRNNLQFNLNGESCVGPFNLSYVLSYFSAYNIIGYYTEVESATLGFDIIDGYYIFNTNQVCTEQQLERHNNKISKMFSEILTVFNGLLSEPEMVKFLENSTAKQTVEYFKNKYPLIAQTFNLKDHNRENFYIGEHTETVLRVFDESFAPFVPKKLYPAIKIALIAHDMGKGVARQNGHRTQETENEQYSQMFFTELGLSEEHKKLLAYIIGPSQKRTTNFYVRGQMQEGVELIKECKILLTEVLGRVPTKEEINALAKMCSIMQTCDTASYSYYGITRDQETGVHYFNDNGMFTRSLTEPSGFLNRTVRMKNPVDKGIK